jgi:hypothetical protein
MTLRYKCRVSFFYFLKVLSFVTQLFIFFNHLIVSFRCIARQGSDFTLNQVYVNNYFVLALKNHCGHGTETYIKGAFKICSSLLLKGNYGLKLMLPFRGWGLLC